jgi:DNA primase
VPGDFDLVKERIDIVALIGERLPLKRAGRVYKGLCPFHSEKTPSFQVDPERRNWHCFGCSRGGDIFTFLEELDHLDRAESLKVLAERAGVELSGKKRTPEEREREDRLRKLMDTAHFYFTQGLRSPDHGKAAAAYLAQRGMTQQAIDKFGLGYAPDLWDGLLSYIKKKAFTEEEGIAAGLLRAGDRGAYDWFRGRLMVPIKDSRGRVIAFGGRAMRADQPGKYVNSPNTSLFTKSETLYALDVAKAAIRRPRPSRMGQAPRSQAVVVEGYFDAIACHQEGLDYVVASMGTALTREQYDVLTRMSVDEVVVTFDGDVAGQQSALRRGIELEQMVDPLLFATPPRAGRSGEIGARTSSEIYIVQLPEGDPDELVRRDRAGFEELLRARVPLLEFLIVETAKLYKLAEPDGQRAFLTAVLPVLEPQPDSLAETYLRRISGLTGVSQEALREDLRAMRNAAVHARPRGALRLNPPAVGAAEPEDRLGTAEMKQTPLQERYVMALLTRFPEEIARVDLVPDDLGDPDLRALLKELQAGKHPSSDLPAHLAATAAALGAAAPELGEETDPRQAIEIAAQRLRVQRLRARLGETRAKLAQLADGDVTALAAEVGRLASDLEAAMARVERRTVLHGDTERREGE